MNGGRSCHHTVSSKRMSGAKKTLRVKTCSDDRIGCWDNRKCQLPNDFGLSVQEQPMHFQCIVVECKCDCVRLQVPWRGNGARKWTPWSCRVSSPTLDSARSELILHSLNPKDSNRKTTSFFHSYGPNSITIRPLLFRVLVGGIHAGYQSHRSEDRRSYGARPLP